MRHSFNSMILVRYRSGKFKETTEETYLFKEIEHKTTKDSISNPNSLETLCNATLLRINSKMTRRLSIPRACKS